MGMLSCAKESAAVRWIVFPFIVMGKNNLDPFFL